MSSPSDCRNAASRASLAAVDARFANTNAKTLKTKPATEARFPQFRTKKSNIGHCKDYGTSAQRFLHLLAILPRLRFDRRRIERQRLRVLHQQLSVHHHVLHIAAF